MVTMYRFSEGRIQKMQTFDPAEMPNFSHRTYWDLGWRWVGALFMQNGELIRIDDIWVNGDGIRAEAESGESSYEIHQERDWIDAVYAGSTPPYEDAVVNELQKEEIPAPTLKTEAEYDLPIGKAYWNHLTGDPRFLVTREKSDSYVVLREILDKFLLNIPLVADSPSSCLGHEWVETGMRKTWCRHCDVEGESTLDYRGIKR